MTIGRLTDARSRLAVCVAGATLTAMLAACGQDNRVKLSRLIPSSTRSAYFSRL
jgi:hypothetical protein